MSGPDCFKTLNITPDASPEEARRAYMSLVRRWHPDQYNDDPMMRERAQERLKLINTAYQEAKKILSEKEKYKQRSPKQPSPSHSAPAPSSHTDETTGIAAGKKTFFHVLGNMVPEWIANLFFRKTEDAHELAKNIGAKKSARPPHRRERRSFKRVFDDAVNARGKAAGSPERPAQKRRRGPVQASSKQGPSLTKPQRKRGGRVEPISRVRRVEKVK